MIRPTIARTHANQAQINLDIINLVADRQTASYAELFARFRDGNGDNEVNAHARFSKRLEHLVDKGKLASQGRGHSRTFTLGLEAVKPPGSAASALKVADAALVARAMERINSQVEHHRPTPPPSINVMAADYPLYRAPPSPAVRPGALDYQSVASRGHRC